VKKKPPAEPPPRFAYYIACNILLVGNVL